MEQPDVVRHTLGVLERLAVPYAIVGSFASIAYGEPRYTRDIDILIDISDDRVADFCREFPAPEWYLSEQAARSAIRDRRQFNVIHNESGNKIDFIVSRGDAWCRLQFERRQSVGVLENLAGFAVHPEDVILGKLLYYQEGGSDKHLRDIVGVLQISGDKVNRSSLDEWASKLGVLDLWHEVLDRSDRGEI